MKMKTGVLLLLSVLLAASVRAAATVAASEPFALDSRAFGWSVGVPMPLCTGPAGLVFVIR